MTRKHILPALFAVAGLSACTAFGPTYTSSVTDTYDPSEYATQTTTRDVPVKVYGSAFGVSGAPLATTVVGNMTGHDWSPHAHFTATDTRSNETPFSVAVVINGPGNTTGDNLCAGNVNQTSPSATGDVRLTAGLCRYGVAVSEVTGQTSGVNGVQDPKFAELVAKAIRELTPPISTFRGNHDSDKS
jgi:hypothetical protein